MALRNNTCEGGTTGTAVSTGNSGGVSGTAFDLISKSGSGSAAFTSNQAAHGSLSVYFFSPGSSAASAEWSISPPASSVACRVYIRFNPLPLQATGLLFAANGCRISINTSNQLTVSDNSATLKTFTSALPISVWYRLELETQVGTTTGNGYLAARYFLGDATTPAETAFSSSTANTGTGTPLTAVDFGLINSTNGGVFMDDFAAQDGTTTPIGPYAPATPAFAGWGIPL